MGIFEDIKLESQQYISKYKLPIMPLCSHNHRGMSEDHQNKCKSPGKSPILKEWQLRQSTTMREVKVWWNSNEAYNIGLVLGDTENYNLIGIDIDGEEGIKHWIELSKGKDVPPTWEFTTGGGGIRLLYQLPKGIHTNKTKEALDGIHQEVAFIAQGQQTVLPPSVHPSGLLYQWAKDRSPLDVDLAFAPRWIQEKVELTKEEFESQKSSTAVVGAEIGNIHEGSRDDTLTRQIGSLASSPAMTFEILLASAHTVNMGFNPPLEEAQVVKCVNSVWEMEIKSRQDRVERERKKALMSPEVLTVGFIQHCFDNGIHLRYRENRDHIMIATAEQGPWKVLSKEQYNVLCKKFLKDTDPKLIRMALLTEIRGLLPSTLVETFKSSGEEFEDIHKHMKESILTANGVLSWRDKKLQPWNPVKNFHTINISAKWQDEVNPTIKKIWDDILIEWIDDQDSVNFLQEYIGYTLLPITNMRVAVFLLGGGVNGKSMFLDAISNIFEECKRSVTLASLNSKHGGIDIQDKLLLLCGDSDSKYLAETGKLKEIISGDTIRVEPKGKHSYDLKPFGKLLLSTNEIPKSSDKSKGWLSRLKIIEFGKTYATNPKFKDKFESQMHSEEGKSVIFKWAVEGLIRLQTNGCFTESRQMKTSAAVYELENDNVAAFITEMLKPHIVYKSMQVHEAALQIHAVYSVYTSWCEKEGLKPVKKASFTKKVGDSYTIKNVSIPTTSGVRVIIRCFASCKFHEDIDKAYISDYKFECANRGR